MRIEWQFSEVFGVTTTDRVNHYSKSLSAVRTSSLNNHLSCGLVSPWLPLQVDYFWGHTAQRDCMRSKLIRCPVIQSVRAYFSMGALCGCEFTWVKQLLVYRHIIEFVMIWLQIFLHRTGRREGSYSKYNDCVLKLKSREGKIYRISNVIPMTALASRRY